MQLEKLVPPPELCEKIPADEFMDAAFCWHYTEVAGFTCGTSGCRQFSGKQWMLERSNSSKIIRYRQRGDLIFPAPTLQEIMAAIPYCRMYKKTTATFIAVHEKTRFAVSKSGAEAALKLWMMLKGVE